MSNTTPDNSNGAPERKLAAESSGEAAAKTIGKGLLFVVGAPLALVGAAVGATIVTAGGVVYGAAKVVEGVGKGIAAGPEVVYKAFAGGEGEGEAAVKGSPGSDQKECQLTKAKNRRRCPSCAIILEPTLGCNHITCCCKTKFCFKCAALWDVQRSSCSRRPSCDLLDETMLLQERERQRELELARRNPALVRVAALPTAPPPYEHSGPAYDFFPPAYHVLHPEDRFLWMDDSNVMGLYTRHPFTANMIDSLTCQYCDAKVNSVADLRYHLNHVRGHSVYACCGRFFKREVDFQHHRNAPQTRLGRHAYTVQRN